jgi:hypothetical protein
LGTSAGGKIPFRKESPERLLLETLSSPALVADEDEEEEEEEEEEEDGGVGGNMFDCDVGGNEGGEAMVETPAPSKSDLLLTLPVPLTAAPPSREKICTVPLSDEQAKCVVRGSNAMQ